ncbi:hypothetical protein CRE_00565 [Caenorhabditis remanei]|uniref:dual-specificity kinase n=1 Tax=Caenorhabditis remanei TaxID=31234 RepID=E3LD53_CAERE|nr:hypothetical protein CRE_00565 [Caenorhabditis remanei]
MSKISETGTKLEELHPVVEQKSVKVEKLKPIFKRVNNGITSQEIISTYSKLITDYEKKEVVNFPVVYTIGAFSAKNYRCHRTGLFTSTCASFETSSGDHVAYRYLVDRVLGDGSYSEVYRCIDRKTETPVAVKILKHNMQIFDEEVQALTKISQLDPVGKSNCIRLLDHGKFRRHHYLVFEMMHCSLATYLDDVKNVSVQECGKMMRSILFALDFLHQNKIVHCDVKPDNILMSSSDPNNLKLADFGLATKDPTDVGDSILQTRHFRAPEIYFQGIITSATDMWSFGCVVAQMVLGKPLMAGRHYYDQLALIEQFFGLPPIPYYKRHLHFYGDYPKHCEKFYDSVTRKPFLRLEMIYHAANPKTGLPGSKTLKDVFPDPEQFVIVEFLSRCFKYEPAERILPTFALKHPLFFQEPNL